MDALSKSQLRSKLRQQRQALSASQQQRAATRLVQQLQRLPAFRRARHIASYLASDGEISTLPLLVACQRRGAQCYLPVIHADARRAEMRFHHYRPQHTLRHNRYGIAEPNALRRRAIDPRQLDVILLPLVGFDRSGRRLGMGGGFYDRALAFKQQRGAQRQRPLLIGLSHHCQEVPHLPSQHWDIPLDLIASDRELIQIRR